MQSENPLIADIVKLMNSAAGTFAGMTREARESARERLKETFGGFDFVSREEFDAVKIMAATARAEVDVLKARLDALEGKGARTPVAAKPAAAPKPAAPQKPAAPKKAAASKPRPKAS